MEKIKRALISVSDKSGLVRFAEGLKRHGVEILSTGGTARTLKEAGIEVTDVSSVTKFPEMLGGRVKTLHPAIHGGLLADRTKPDHLQQLKEHEIEPIDMVVVNLYPFQATVAKPGVKLSEAIENIDIGGPSMIRSAAKNFASVAVVVNPSQYNQVIKEMDDNQGGLSDETRRELAKEAFRLTADYDEAIYEFFEGSQDFPTFLKHGYEKIQDLRYGENPHQKASYYQDELSPAGTLVKAEQLQGKQLSFNNILDLDAALRIVKEFSQPACVVIKHTNPCGVAISNSIAKAFKQAYAADSVSAFGSVVSVNRQVDKEMASEVVNHFIEAVIAPSFAPEALEVLASKKNLRLLSMANANASSYQQKDVRKVDGGILVQDFDNSSEEAKDMKVAAGGNPSDSQWEDLLFAWRVAKHVKSNAIVLAKDKVTIGIGAGQMSRVDATELAIKKAGANNCAGAVMASDAFFPFRDAVDAAAKVGVTAIIQPGGSIRDKEVIEAAEEHKIPMVFTGVRHFRH